ncbi:hypothetical protein BFJ63_vAg9237 [Fusarium oxysporum f. sp. narcissi]|uniref:Uncharacterized protein n=1 Tax=Fusarium oxysporum f. sp. narcissi TaxID=451672 RepID=A0A4Q2VNE4_FUSOX|nr:hypothetical protein BFJ63_vAg9237 [Fusarium oxysporum f. sp. narcissi]
MREHKSHVKDSAESTTTVIPVKLDTTGPPMFKICPRTKNGIIHADHHHTNVDLLWNDSPLATASSTTSVPGTLGKSHLTLLDYSYVVHGSETRPPLSIRRIYVPEP